MEHADIWRMIDDYLLAQTIKGRIDEPAEPWTERTPVDERAWAADGMKR